MWRLQDLYSLLLRDPHYNVTILLYPFLTYATNQREKCIKELKDYFDANNCSYQIYDKEAFKPQWRKNRPDIIFYPQMYRTIFPKPLNIDSNLDRLICYLPYSLMTVKGEWVYNTKYTNLAWKLFYPTTIHADHARHNSFNKGRNVIVVGEPNATKYLQQGYSYQWKPQSNNSIKRVIWAPHFSILEKVYLHRGGFLWLADIMCDIVKLYEGRIQFVLKPHPSLISSFYAHQDWGKERTDRYFNQWSDGKNTQVETGEYIDLFMTSDAMIHDCGSFTAEYLFTNKPVLFTSKDINNVYSTLDPFGVKCLDLHYKGSSKEDLIAFLDNVVIDGEDPLSDSRRLFYEDILLRETAGDVGNNIYQALNKELFSPKCK